MARHFVFACEKSAEWKFLSTDFVHRAVVSSPALQDYPGRGVKVRRSTDNSVHKFALRFATLLGRLNDGLRFRVIPDHDEITVIRRHRLRRVGRADDRESLRSERKTEQDAEGERFHIAVLLCIIRAIEICNSYRDGSVDKPPPADGISEKRVSATEDRQIRLRYRDNTRDAPRNNNNPQHVQTAADITGQKFGCPMFC